MIDQPARRHAQDGGREEPARRACSSADDRQAAAAAAGPRTTAPAEWHPPTESSGEKPARRVCTVLSPRTGIHRIQRFDAGFARSAELLGIGREVEEHQFRTLARDAGPTSASRWRARRRARSGRCRRSNCRRGRTTRSRHRATRPSPRVVPPARARACGGTATGRARRRSCDRATRSTYPSFDLVAFDAHDVGTVGRFDRGISWRTDTSSRAWSRAAWRSSSEARRATPSRRHPRARAVPSAGGSRGLRTRPQTPCRAYGTGSRAASLACSAGCSTLPRPSPTLPAESGCSPGHASDRWRSLNPR